MNPQFLIGLVLFIGGFLLLVSGFVPGVILVIVGGILARMGSKDLVAKKIREQQKKQ